MEFHAILGRQDEVVAEYFRAFQAANDTRAMERRAATTMESSWRMFVVRARFRDVVWSTRHIQRLARGHLGRRKAQVAALDRHRERNRVFFKHCASIIQKHFRGHWSRKYYHHMRARREYLDSTAERGDRTVDFLQKTYEERKAEHDQREEERLRSEFKGLASQLHHLVSTERIPGIYNPPYSEVVPTAFGEPVELYLRKSNPVRLPDSLKRPSHRSRATPPGTRLKPLEQVEPKSSPHADLLISRTAAVGRLRAIQGPFRTREEIALMNARAFKHYRSLNAECEYDAVRTNERMAAKIAKMTWTSADTFAWRKVTEAPVLGSANAETEMQHRPVEFREDYTEIPQIGNRPPFYTGMPVGKLFTEYEDPHRYVTLQGGS